MAQEEEKTQTFIFNDDSMFNCINEEDEDLKDDAITGNLNLEILINEYEVKPIYASKIMTAFHQLQQTHNAKIKTLDDTIKQKDTKIKNLMNNTQNHEIIVEDTKQSEHENINIADTEKRPKIEHNQLSEPHITQQTIQSTQQATHSTEGEVSPLTPPSLSISPSISPSNSDSEVDEDIDIENTPSSSDIMIIDNIPTQLINKPITIDDVKMVDKKTNLTVNGYFRYIQSSSQLDLDPTVRIFVHIPALVINWVKLYHHDSFPKVVRDIYSPFPQTQFGSMVQIRTMLSIPDNPPITKVMNAGIIPRIHKLAKDARNPHLQYEALWALVNIRSASGADGVSGDEEEEEDEHKVLMEIASKSRYYEIKDQVMWALGNIAGDSAENKDLLLNDGILTHILPICQHEYNQQYTTNFNGLDVTKKEPLYTFLSLLSTASWTLSNLCRCTPPPTIEHLKMIMTSLRFLLSKSKKYVEHAKNTWIGHEDNGENDDKKGENYQRLFENVNELTVNVLWSLSYLTSNDYNISSYDGLGYIIKEMCSNRMLSECVNLMDDKVSNVRRACNRIIGNILTGNEQHTQICIKLGILQKFHNILTTYCNPDNNDENKNSVVIKRERKEICWALSNITAGSMKDIMLVEKHGLFKILCKCLSYQPEVAREALWALSNVTSIGDRDSKDIIDKLIKEYGLIESMFGYLKQTGYISNKMIMVGLECVDNILKCMEGANGNCDEYKDKFEKAGFKDYMEELLVNESISGEVCDFVEDILIKYFHDESRIITYKF